MKYEIKIKTPDDEYTSTLLSWNDRASFFKTLDNKELIYLVIKIRNDYLNKDEQLLLYGNVLKNTTFIIREIEND